MLSEKSSWFSKTESMEPRKQNKKELKIWLNIYQDTGLLIGNRKKIDFEARDKMTGFRKAFFGRAVTGKKDN